MRNKRKPTSFEDFNREILGEPHYPGDFAAEIFSKTYAQLTEDVDRRFVENRAQAHHRSYQKLLETLDRENNKLVVPSKHKCRFLVSKLTNNDVTDIPDGAVEECTHPVRLVEKKNLTHLRELNERFKATISTLGYIALPGEVKLSRNQRELIESAIQVLENVIENYRQARGLENADGLARKETKSSE